jgi:lipoprotein signal peptidase
MKEFNLYLYIMVFIVLVLPLYQISKYGISGYYQKKFERKQKRAQQVINLFS